jgi:hypothetical protein
MRVILLIVGIGATKKRLRMPQERFSREGRDAGYPLSASSTESWTFHDD